MAHLVHTKSNYVWKIIWFLFEHAQAIQKAAIKCLGNQIKTTRRPKIQRAPSHHTHEKKTHPDWDCGIPNACVIDLISIHLMWSERVQLFGVTFLLHKILIGTIKCTFYIRKNVWALVPFKRILLRKSLNCSSRLSFNTENERVKWAEQMWILWKLLFNE